VSHDGDGNVATLVEWGKDRTFSPGLIPMQTEQIEIGRRLASDSFTDFAIPPFRRHPAQPSNISCI